MNLLLMLLERCGTRTIQHGARRWKFNIGGQGARLTCRLRQGPHPHLDGLGFSCVSASGNHCDAEEETESRADAEASDHALMEESGLGVRESGAAASASETSVAEESDCHGDEGFDGDAGGF